MIPYDLKILFTFHVPHRLFHLYFDHFVGIFIGFMLRNAASAHAEIEVFRSNDRTRAGTHAPLNLEIAASFSCRHRRRRK